MGLLSVLFWLLFAYGVIALVLRLIPVEREVPSDEKDQWGGSKKKKINEPLRLPFAIPAVIIGFLVGFMFSIIVKVGPQDVGVVVTPKGVRSVAFHTGWHIILPWQDIHMMDKTVWVYTCANAPREGAKPNSDAIWSPTKDGIKMGMDISVSWKIMPDEAPWIYQNVTENDGGNTGRYIWLEENVIRTKTKSALALTVSNFTPIEVYSTKRQEIQDDVVKKIREELKEYRLLLEQVDIREVYYSPEFEKSIDAKKLAEQEALRLVEVTKQREELKKQEAINKDIAILKAEGESRALQIKGQSITNNPKIIELEWINKWNGVLPTYMMGNGQGVILNLPNK
jgi:regulator of protease activity HflC (stomatin/prohibitin superfamily)